MVVKGRIGLVDQGGLNFLFADLDEGFQFVPEGTQMAFLFSGQHGVGILLVTSR
jgi:hypothetical protein